MNQIAVSNGFAWGANTPAYLKTPAAVARHQALSAGLPVGSWGKVSYAGSKWALVSPEGTKQYLNSMTLDFFIVRANSHISKRFYEGLYDPTQDGAPPDCWADNGVGPGPRVANPVSPTCQGCPNNQWGSDTGAGGGATKACTDVKRLSIAVFAGSVTDPSTGALAPRNRLPATYELDIPAASLKNLKAFTKHVESNGAAVTVVVVRASFVPEANYPQLQFQALDFISEEENAWADSVYDSETVKLQCGEAESGAPLHSSAPPATPALPKPAAPMPTLQTAPPAAHPVAIQPVPVQPPPAAPTVAVPPNVDPAAWLAFMASQAGQAAQANTVPPAPAPAAPAAAFPLPQAAEAAPAKRGRGRPPAGGKPAAAPQQTGFMQQPATVAQVQQPQFMQAAPAQLPQQAVQLNPQQTSAEVDNILAGIPGL